MDTDDTGRLRSAPRALAQAAWLTLGKSISDIFTYNSGVGHTLSTPEPCSTQRPSARPADTPTC